MVPGLAVVVAFILVIVSIMVLVWYVHHIGRSLRVAALIELVGTDTRKLLDTNCIPIPERHPGVDEQRCARPRSGGHYADRSPSVGRSRRGRRLRAEADSRPR